MTTHYQRELGETLADELSGMTFPGAIPTVDAVYRRRPDWGREEIGTLKVSVVPGPIAVGPDGNVPQAPRGCDIFSVTYGIVFAQVVTSEQQIDDLEDLCQAVMDAIRSHHLDLPEGVDWIAFGQPMTFDPAELEERQTFLSQVEVTYMLPKDKTAPVPPPEPEGE